MNFNIITIFPEVFDPYFKTSILGRAQERGLVNFNVLNLRDFSKDKHKKVDDEPFGGGAGMVMGVEPIYRSIKFIREKINEEIMNGKFQMLNDKFQNNGKCPMTNFKTTVDKSKIILLSAKGKKFDQRKAEELAQLDNITLICGRYEGVDERVAEYIADEEISIGDYVLTGGELPAMIVADAVARLLPGVISEESLKEESFMNDKLNNMEADLIFTHEYPQYTRPAIFTTDEGEEWKVIEVLLSGNHEEIRKWRANQ